MARLRLGSFLHESVKREVLRRYVHRYTSEHVPDWVARAKSDGIQYAVHFANDADWLHHTWFWVTKSGELDKRYNHCVTHVASSAGDKDLG